MSDVRNEKSESGLFHYTTPLAMRFVCADFQNGGKPVYNFEEILTADVDLNDLVFIFTRQEPFLYRKKFLKN